MLKAYWCRLLIFNIPSGRIYTYIYINGGFFHLSYIYVNMLCAFSVQLANLCVIVLSLLSNEVACAAPKTVIHLLKQGSYFVCIDLSYTVVVKWGYIKRNKNFI